MGNFLKDALSSGKPASSKRLISFVLIIVYIVIAFIVVYLKRPVVNKDLVETMLSNIFWLIVVYGGLTGFENAIGRLGVKSTLEGQAKVEQAKTGTPDVVNQNVENQTVTNTTP